MITLSIIIVAKTVSIVLAILLLPYAIYLLYDKSLILEPGKCVMVIYIPLVSHIISSMFLSLIIFEYLLFVIIGIINLKDYFITRKLSKTTNMSYIDPYNEEDWNEIDKGNKPVESLIVTLYNKIRGFRLG